MFCNTFELLSRVIADFRIFIKFYDVDICRHFDNLRLFFYGSAVKFIIGWP